MLQNIIGFFEMIGVEPIKGSFIIIMAAVAAALSYKKLEYKVEEKTNKDGNKEYKIFKYKW